MSEKPLLYASCIGIASFVLFLVFQAQGISAGDSGDLAGAAATFGVPHPSGYPLYTAIGWIFTRLPFGTTAWRVALLSSIPHAIAVGLLFSFVYLLTKRTSAAFFAAMVLVGNYAFFLYSVIAEVYGLANLFIILLVYLVWKKQYALSAFVFGLGLSHHHGILFLVGAIICWWLVVKNALRTLDVFRMLAWFVIGLLPHVYFFIAGTKDSMINWLGDATLSNVVRVFTLSDYGVFTSSAFYGELPVQRLLGLKAYGQLLFADFTFIGVALAVVGALFLYQKVRSVFWLFSLAFFFLGPIWYFYGSFPLMNRFTIGTYEQFLPSSYLFIVLFMGVGFSRVIELGRRRLLAVGLGLVLFLLPLVQGYSTLWRFWGHAADRTAENLAIDLLNPLPEGSMLLLRSDTPLFPTLYLRYVENVRSDLIVLHETKLSTPYYRQIVRRIYPDVSVPEPDPDAPYIRQFIDANRTSGIYSNTKLPVSSGLAWVPYGLVFRLTPLEALPNMDQFIAQNSRVWQTFHDPNSGILGRYPHLLLADVRDVYAAGREHMGDILIRAGRFKDAARVFRVAVGYGGDTALPDLYLKLGVSNLFAGQCNEAISAFGKTREKSLSPPEELTYFEAVAQKDCLKNAAAARDLFEKYQKERESRATRLEK